MRDPALRRPGGDSEAGVRAGWMLGRCATRGAGVPPVRAAVLAVVAAALGALALAGPAAAHSGAVPMLTPGGLTGFAEQLGAGAADGGKRVRRAHSGISLSPSETEPHWACPTGACEAIVEPPVTRKTVGANHATRFALPKSARL